MVGVMGEKYGAPYNQFPYTMMEVGKSGMDDWGVFCGSLLGVQMAFALFYGRKERIPMMNELFRWYEITAFPIYNPGDKAQVKGDVPTSVSDSIICHVSLSKWCYKTKTDHASKKRQERCARLTADVAMKGIEILNAKIDGTFKNTLKVADAVTTCGECHSPGKSVDIQKGKMDCTPCHSGNPHTANKFMNHP